MTTELTRIRLDMSAVSDIMFANVPEWIWESDSTTFLDPSMGAGQFLFEIKKKLLSYGHSEDNIASRLFGYATDFFALQYGINRFELRGEFIIGDFLEAKIVRKFDVVISNPPYDGKAQLHQRFFNTAIEWVHDNGVVCFIQPATPYFNRKDTRTHEIKMRKIVSTHTVTCSILSGTVFQNAGIFGDVAVTTLIKNHKSRLSVSYKNGDRFNDVTLNDINTLEIEPSVFRSMNDKIESFIAKNGSMFNILDTLGKSRGAYVQRVRGNVATNNYFTIVSNDPANYKFVSDGQGMTIAIDENQLDSLISYLKTYVARFAQSINKINGNNGSNGSFKLLPLVPFDRNWTDEELAQLIGLTDEELSVIRSVLPDYHGLFT